MDYQAIVDGITIDRVKQLLERLGAKEIIEKDGYLITNTICHHTDSEEASLKLYYYDNNKVFMCYTQCETMSIFKFLQHYYETRGIDYDWVSDIYKVVLDCSYFNNDLVFERPVYKSLRQKFDKLSRDVVLPEYNEGILDTFIKFHAPEWLEDGISAAAMDKFGILYSISQHKIVIPHRDADGRLVGIRGRALDKWEIENVGKYCPIKVEQTWYKHPLGMNLYGLYENQQHIKDAGIVYVFEGEKSVLQSESFSSLNCAVAVCGSQFNHFQLNLLLRQCQPREIVICFDKEELPGKSTYFDKLWRMCQKYKNYANFSFIYDRMGLLGLKESPTDRGEEVFRKLLEKRVRVQ